MDLTSILGLLQLLSPVLSKAAAGTAANQNFNTTAATSEAAVRPSIVGKNLSNSMKASMFSNYTPPKLNWGGPGSVAKGQIPTITGGPSPLSPATSALQQQVEQDALDQANNNYGLKDPSAGSGVSNALGVGSLATGVLGALKPLTGGGGAPSSGSGGGSSPDAPPGTTGAYDPNFMGPQNPFSGPTDQNTPGAAGTPGDLSQVDPNGIAAVTPEQISQLLAYLGIPSFSGFGGSAREPGGPPDGSAETVGYM